MKTPNTGKSMTCSNLYCMKVEDNIKDQDLSSLETDDLAIEKVNNALRSFLNGDALLDKSE